MTNLAETARPIVLILIVFLTVVSSRDTIVIGRETNDLFP